MARSDGGGPAMTTQPRRNAGQTLRVLALVVIAIGLAVLTAAACVLSYGSIQALAGKAGVSAPLARIYPLIFDAMLVLAGSSVLALRGAGLVSRLYGWLCFLVLLIGLAAGGVIRAAAIIVPRRPAGIAAAIIPFALVLIGFGLLLALLRYGRLRRLGQQAGRQPQEQAPEEALETTQPVRVAIPGMPATRPETPPESTSLSMAMSPAPVTAPDPVTAVAAVVSATGVAGSPTMTTDASASTRPTVVSQVKVDPVKLAVRATEMQLRARVPRQPAAGQQKDDTAQQEDHTQQEDRTGRVASAAPGDGDSEVQPASPAPPERQEPFMPPVARPKADGPAAKGRKTSPRLTKGDERPVTKSVPSGDAGKAGPDASEATANPVPDVPQAEGSAARASAAGADPAEPPAFDRPRSSPTPPEG